MAATALVLPPQPVPVIDAGGLVSLPWRSSLQNALNNLQAQITALAALEGDTTALETALAALQGEVDAAEASIAAHIADTANPHATTAAQVGADPAGTAAAEVAAHVALADPHAQYLTEAAATAGYQPLDATLTALAGANWALNALPIGTGPDTLNQVAFAANTFPGRGSTGDVVAKPITDGALSVLAGTAGTDKLLRGDGTASGTLVGVLSVDTSGNPGAAGATSVLIFGDGNKERIEGRGAQGGAPTFQGKTCGGTLGAATATVSGATLVQVGGSGHDGTDFVLANKGIIRVVADGLWSSTSQGVLLHFILTKTGATSTSVRWVMGYDNFSPNVDNAHSFGSPSFRLSADYVVQRNTSGAEYHTGEQAVSLTANTDNQSVTSTTRVLRVSSNGAYNLTGLTGGAAGRRLTLLNVSAFTITLTHDATSTAANRFFCPNNTSVAVRQNGATELIYDATSSRWRVIGA